MRTHSHWMIRKSRKTAQARPWQISHPGDGCAAASVVGWRKHFNDFAGAVAAVGNLSWEYCGLAYDLVPFYGLELGIDTPNGWRTCALDVAGFRFLEQATFYANTLRWLPAEAASTRAERDGYMVSAMDADDGDLHLPLTGATVYRYDPQVGTTWNHDLLSWEPTPGPVAP